MKAFMDKDFLLETPTAQHLYHDYSAKLKDAGKENIPIVSTGGSPDGFKMLQDGIEAANMTAPVSIQGVKTFMNLYNKVALGEDPAEKFTALPVIPVSADDTSSYIAWDDYAAAYKYLGENK